MKRDMDLVRKILKEIQSRDNLKPAELTIEGCDQNVVGRHVEMLHSAGMIEGIVSKSLGKPYATVLVRDLTWSGHDFIATIETKGVWETIKKSISAEELAAMPLTVLKDVGLELAKRYLLGAVGLSSS